MPREYFSGDSAPTQRRGHTPGEPCTPRVDARLALLAAGAAAIAGAVGGFNASAAPSTSSKNPNSDATVSTGLDSTSAVVGLSLAPLATDAKLAPAKGKKVDFNSSAAKSERAKLVAQRNTFKQWLQSNAPKAQVTGEYDVAVNAVAVRLNGTSARARCATARAWPRPATRRRTPRPSARPDDPDLSLIKAEPGPATPRPRPAPGIKVGIVDTGIDVTHPCFDDAGFPATQQQGNPAYTNNKVIVAKVFANKARQAGPHREGGPGPRHPRRRHGRLQREHPGQVDGATSPTRPAASPREPSSAATTSSRATSRTPAARTSSTRSQAAAARRHGRHQHEPRWQRQGVQDLLTNAVDNLDQAGIVVAVSAGNEGPGHYTDRLPGLRRAGADRRCLLGRPLHRPCR